MDSNMPEHSVMHKLELIIQAKKAQIERNSYSKSIPLAQFYDRERLEMMDAIYSILKSFDDRISGIEKSNN
jgi:hypothetical protein